MDALIRYVFGNPMGTLKMIAYGKIYDMVRQQHFDEILLRVGTDTDRWRRIAELSLFVLGLSLSFGVMLLFAIQT